MELKKLNRIESTKIIYRILDKELKRDHEQITNRIDNNYEIITEQIQENSVRENDDHISLKNLGEDIRVNITGSYLIIYG